MKYIETPGLGVKAHLLSEDNQTRTPGLHLSDILDSIEETLGIEHEDPWNLNACATMGFLWERVLSKSLVDAVIETGGNGIEHCGRLIRPGEVEKDGILMTPDAFDIDNWVLEEWKCKWCSFDKPIEEYLRYLMQVKSYCLAMDTRRVRVRMLFVVGDYKTRFKPDPKDKVWHVEFTERELKDNWNMILKHAKDKGML